MYSLTNVPAGLTFTASTRTLSGTPTTNAPATTLTYHVMDVGSGKSTTGTFTVTVVPAPLVFPPSIGVGAFPMLDYIALFYNKDEAITPLVFPAATGGTGTLTYSLTGDAEVFDVESLGLAFDKSARTLSGTPILAGGGPNGAGFELTYTVEDEIGISASVSVLITLCENTAVPAGTTNCIPPQLIVVGISVIANQSYPASIVITPLTLPVAIGGTGTNPLFAYTLGNLPTGMSFDPNSRILSGAPTTEASARTLKYTAIDVSSQKISFREFKITVTAKVNEAPVISGDPPTTVAEDAFYTFTPTVTDVNVGDTHTYTIAGNPGWLSIDPESGVVSGTPTNADVEVTNSITITVTDDEEATADLTAFDLIVTNTNDAPVGLPSITGTATQGNILTAGIDDITDADGLGTLTSSPSYQWQGDGTAISDATERTFELTQDQVDETITVTVSYTDGGGTGESLTSAATGAVTNTNDVPTGVPTITGTATQNETLTAGIDDITDADGLGTLTSSPSYQWQGDGTDITGAIESTFTLTQDQVGETITVTVSYTDGQSTDESVTSDATGAVTNTNDDPVGVPTIDGTATQGNLLTAGIDDIADDDGLGEFSYQWNTGDTNTPITGATLSTFTLTQAQVDETITVTVSYRDDDGTAESVTSAATVSVSNINDDPVGVPTIDGTVTQGQILTAVITGITDADGLGTLTSSPSYQWNTGDTNTPITGAIESTFTLTQDQVGQTITVTVSYTDGYGMNESVTSAATASVSNINDAPTISGIPGTSVAEDVLYTFTSTGADVDAGTTLTYTITNKPDWASFSSTTGVLTGTPTNADVGTTTGIVISVSDGIIATPVSLPAFDLTVTNTNDAPTITGAPGTTVAEDALYTFTAVGADVDTSDTLTYTIANNPGWASFSSTTGVLTGTPTNADVGTTTGIVISVSDGIIATPVSLPAFDLTVTNTNDAPTGLPTIVGMVDQRQTLTAITTDIADDDGLGEFSYQWKAGGTDINSATLSTFTLTQAQVGQTITVTVSYTDGYGMNESVTSVATIAVMNVNDAPTITGTPDTTVAEDSAYSFTSTGVDIDTGDTLTYTITNMPDWASFSDTTGTLSGTPDNADVGVTNNITISVSDGTLSANLAAFSITVTNTNDAATGVPTISGTATQGETLTAETGDIVDDDGLGDFSYQWKAGGTDISSATETTFTLTQDQVGEVITVTVSYRDDDGTAESVTSEATAAVANINDTPIGLPTISGTATQGEILTADTGAIMDADGPTTLTFTYQWQAGGADITGAIESTFTLTQDQVGALITVTVSYRDDDGTAESVTSAATTQVTNTNDATTGVPTITGTVTQKQTLTAVTTGIMDDDGVGDFTYQWQAGGTAISDATERTFILTQAEVDETITVTVSFTDGGGTGESVTSLATTAVANTNDDPVGSPTIVGVATQGQILTAVTTGIADADGLGEFSYQWKAGGTDITGATEHTFPLTQDQVGQTITVMVSYTDGDGTAESVTSDATDQVTNTNDAPTITGTPDTTVAEDALYTFTAVGADIDTGDTLTYRITNMPSWASFSDTTGTLSGTPDNADVGVTNNITISVSDGTLSANLAAFSITVTNTNDDPVGLPSITGTATQGNLLTAVTTGITDADGLGDFSYQWKAGGTDISSATETTFTLTQDQVGEVITVTVSYTDGQSTDESVTSAATGAVTNTNDPAIGLPSITGTVTQGNLLTAVTTGIADADGPTTLTFTYQWNAGGAAITGATERTFPLTQDQVGETITVTVSYTDGGSTAESVTSAATGAVTNTNDDPVGLPSITGTATQGETLTAETGDIVDADGLGTLTTSPSYQWKAGGTDISGATSDVFTLTQDQVGETITVTVSYTDGGGTGESVTSLATAQVTNTNDDPVGLPIIFGAVTQGQTLTASASEITDADGLGTLTTSPSYQWKAGGTDISGATESTFTLTQDQVGETITVTVSYTDGGGTGESVTSDATLAVANVNDDPTITGTPDTTVAEDAPYSFTPGGGDIDSDTLTYAIVNKPDWTDFDANNGALTGTPTNADVGRTRDIVISVTDGMQSISLPKFDLTVTNVNDAPTITGTPDTTVAEDTPYTFTPTGADVDAGTTLTYTIQNEPSWADFDTSTGALTGMPGNADVRTYSNIVISVSDGIIVTPVSLLAFDLEVTNVNDAPTGLPSITGTATQGNLLTAVTTGIMDDDGPTTLTFTYQWQGDGADITGATERTFTLTQDQVGETITVTVSYTDGGGTGESVTSAATGAVTNTNDAPTGLPSITGTATQGNLLTAVTTGIMDDDGPTTLTFTYQWQGDGADITGATERTFTLTQDQVGETITVTVSYTDGGGTGESVTSAATGAVTNTNDAPTISGTPDTTVAQDTPYTFTPTGNDIDVGDMLTYTLAGSPAWLSIDSTTGTLSGTPANADVRTTNGIVITVSDAGGLNATLTFNLRVINRNDAPTISGTPDTTVAEDATYTFTAIGADDDVDATLTYTIINNPAWLSINSVTGVVSGTPTNADVRTTNGIVISVTDGIAASVSLPAFSITVTDVNDAPVGLPTITGTVTQEQTLTAVTAGIDDADGVGAFNYQWKADDTDISGATASTFTLTQAQVGQVITVTVSYTDDQSTDETLSSAATNAVTNTNNAATGRPTISGTVTQGNILTAVTTGIADADGVGAFNYQWKADDTDISGATERTFTLTEDQLGQVITVTVSYTDGDGTAETLTSAATRPVGDINAGFADLNKVVLPEVARAMADQTVNAITQRMDQARSGEGSRSMTIGGQSTLAGAASVHGQAIADGSLSLKDVLGNSDFVLPLADDEAGTDNGMLSFLTLWGGGSYRNLDGSSGSMNFEGDLFSTHLGVDARPRDDLLTGLAVSWGQSDLDYKGDRNFAGDYKLDLTSIHPYANWEVLAGQLDLWVTAGYGWGDLEILDDQQGQALSDVEAWNMAVGGNMELLQEGPARFRLKSSALLTEMEVEGSATITALEVESSLLRMILEGAYKHALAGEAYVEPSLEAGVRYDGGDGETGFGAEFGAGLRYTDPVAGLTLESKARTLVGRDNYEEWGISGLILLEQGRNGRGLSFSLSPGYGDTGSGTQKVWQGQGGLRDEISRDYGARLDTRIGYGMTAPGGRGLLTPYSEMTLGSSDRSYRLGMRWELDTLFDLNLIGERRESNSSTDDHAIMLKGDIQF